MTNELKPCPDAVEALAFILAGPYCQNVDDQFSKYVIQKLAAQGYMITRSAAPDDHIADAGKMVPSGELAEAIQQLSWVNRMDFLGERVPPDVKAVRVLLSKLEALRKAQPSATPAKPKMSEAELEQEAEELCIYEMMGPDDTHRLMHKSDAIELARMYRGDN